MTRFNNTFLFAISVFLYQISWGQTFQLIHKGKSRLESLYDICKVSENEYWLGGKSGTLLIMDSMGNRKKIDMPEKTGQILRILSNDNYVFMSSSEGSLYRYDKSNQLFSRYDVFTRKNLCIYDMMLLKDNSLIIAGGAKKIARAQPAYPRGFIAQMKIDPSVKIKKLWKNPNAFVFTLARHQNEIVAAAYQVPSFSSAVLVSDDEGNSWKKQSNIKGIITAFVSSGKDLYYSGSPDIRYYKDGMFGSVTNPEFRIENEGSGCYHNIISSDDHIYLCNYKGQIESVDIANKTIDKLNLHNSFPLYRMMEMGKNKICIVGHGCTIYFMHTGKEESLDISDSQKGQNK